MKKIFSITFLITLLILTLTGCAGKPTSSTSASQSTENQEDATAQPDKGKQLKIKVLEKSWKNIGQYSEGLCPVQDNANGLWGYVDKSGEYVIKPTYYDAYPFSEALAAVKNKKGTFDFIDKTGKIVFQSNYTSISSRYNGAVKGFLGGYALVCMQKSNKEQFGLSLINKTGKIVAQDDYFLRISYYGLKKGPFIDCQDNIVNMQYNKVKLPEGRGREIDFSFSTKYSLFADNVVDEKGTIIFDASGIEATSLGLTDNYLVAKKNVNGVMTSAVYDFSGKVVIDYNYKEIYPVDKDTFMVVNNGDKYGMINKELQELIPIAQSKMTMPYSVSMGYRLGITPSYFDLQTGMGRLTYIGTDDKGIPTRYYYDLSKKQIEKDAQISSPNGDMTNYNFINGDIVYRWENKADIITVYSTDGIEFGKVPVFFRQPEFDYLESSLFYKDNIIPTYREDKTGYTFAVIE